MTGGEPRTLTWPSLTDIHTLLPGPLTPGDKMVNEAGTAGEGNQSQPTTSPVTESTANRKLAEAEHDDKGAKKKLERHIQ